MNTENLIKPVSRLPEHLQDLRRDANNIAEDMKTEVRSRIDGAKDGVRSQIDQARNRVTDSFAAARQFAADHPFALFGAGVFVGLLWAARRK